MNRPSAPRTNTREKLIEAAAALIPEVGWGGTSSRRVAERAGVNVGVVHYHVGSIDELRRIAAVRKVRAFFLDRIDRALAERDPAEAVAVLLRTLSGTDPRDPELLLLYESLVAASRDDQLRVEIAASLAEMRQRLCQWLSEREVSHPRAIAVTLTAAIDGYLLQRSLDPTLEPDHLVEGLVSIVKRELR